MSKESESSNKAFSSIWGGIKKGASRNRFSSEQNSMNRNSNYGQGHQNLESSSRETGVFLKRTTPAIFCLSLFIVVLSAGITLAESDMNNVENTRGELEKWVETRRIISQEKRDWTLGQEMLNERIGLVEGEIESLQNKIYEAKKSITEADKKRNEMMAENDKLKEAAAALRSTVLAFENRTKDLLRRLPDPIRERVKPLSQRLPDKPDETKLSLSERFQNVVGILNEVNKFNREITATSEVRAFANGTSAEVTALYVGIGQSYYATAKGDLAGVGTSSDEGWVWNPANEAAAPILDAVSILNNEKVASFKQLPINIQ